MHLPRSRTKHLEEELVHVSVVAEAATAVGDDAQRKAALLTVRLEAERQSMRGERREHERFAARAAEVRQTLSHTR